MKKILYVTLALLLVLPVACTKPATPADNNKQDETPQPQPQPQPQDPVLNSISLSKATLALKVGDKETLTVTLDPADFSKEGLAWTSTNTAVATVDKNGQVTAVAAGDAVVKATLSGKEATCTVTVTKKDDQPSGEWDGETFVDRTADWECAFVDYGTYWLWEVHTTTADYVLVKYIMEDEDFMGAPESIRKSPVDIKAAYQYYCVNVDESYLVNAVTNVLPASDELLWPGGYGHAQGYVFGFDKNKKFTGEYAHVTSEHVF